MDNTRDSLPRKIFKKIGITVFVLASLYVIHEKWYMAEGLHLEIEGIVKKPNFRDVGKSINKCLKDSGHEPVLREDILFRSNKWYSGWSCDNVGNPDFIYTLNYEPDKNFSYYCKRDDGSKNIGHIFSKEKEIKDIEFLESWSDATLKTVVCGTFEKIYSNMINGRSSLFHCEAGRDRTGAVAALFAALALERSTLNPEIANGAIECDYRKSKSIHAGKYGRMANFVSSIRSQSLENSKMPVATWLQKTCGLDPKLQEDAIKVLSL